MKVGAVLRLHGAPYCLFGEGPAERRDRLKDLLSRLSSDQHQYLITEEETPGMFYLALICPIINSI